MSDMHQKIDNLPAKDKKTLNEYDRAILRHAKSKERADKWRKSPEGIAYEAARNQRRREQARKVSNNG